MLTPGAHPGLSEAEYDRIPALRSSVLRELALHTPLHARYTEQRGGRDSQAKQVGSLLHLALLEPERFDAECVVRPEFGDCRNRENKAKRDLWDAEHAAHVVVSEETWTDVQAYRDAIYDHPILAGLLTARGVNELTLVWDDPLGVRCKARLDRFAEFGERLAICEFKTSRSASPWSFAGDFMRFGYHVQAGFYLRGLEQTYGPAERPYIIGVVEKGPPTLAAAYELTAEELDLCEAAFHAALKRYSECVESGRWPGYSDCLERLKLPAWAYKRASADALPEGDLW